MSRRPLRAPQSPIVSGAAAGGGTDPEAGPVGQTLLLIGNPNVGKSVLFKNLTSHYVTVSNFPGTTVEIVRARASFDGRAIEVVDTPGIYDLTPWSDDARVTRRLLDESTGATVVQVADAKNLRRALLLTLQLAELRRPMVLVLNMLDELDARGGAIDADRLSAVLGIPVVGTVAPQNVGTQALIDALPRARPPRPAAGVPATDDPYTQNRARLAHINTILADTYSLTPPAAPSLGVRLGFWAMHPVRGIGVLLLMLLGVFWLVGLFGAGTLVDLLEVGVFQQRLNPAAIRTVDWALPFPHDHAPEPLAMVIALPVTPVHEVAVGTVPRRVVTPGYALAAAELSTGQTVRRFVHDFLVGEYGVITMALSYALAIVLPIVTVFFLVFGLLEDSGYFSRMAIMLNRVFRAMGLNGKAVLPMILGLGCDTMATMATRVLETRKERIVATMLLALAVPCSAQLGVLLAMMASASAIGAVVWLGVVVAVILVVGRLTSRIIGGDASEFILEIPPMRRPQLANVTTKTLGRVNWYLREVIPLFVLGTAALFLLDRLGFLAALARTGEPLVTGWLGLPADMANAFLVGFMRRDFGAVYILDAGIGPGGVLTAHQVLVAMVTITLFMPCIANFLMIAREHGLRIALSMAAFIFPFAFFVGGVIHHVGSWLTSI